MTLFRLDASIRAGGSHSGAIADIVESEWAADRPGAPVIHRQVGTDPVPAGAWAAAVAAGQTPEEQRAAVALAARDVDALIAADALLFAVPLYNFGVSQHFKAWVDLVLTDPRLLPGTQPVLSGKPAVLVAVRGGGYGPGTPRHGWDHATGWMHRILVDVWGLDLQVIERELTLVGVNPALDELADVAAEGHARAEAQARSHGRTLSGRPAA